MRSSPEQIIPAWNQGYLEQRPSGPREGQLWHVGGTFLSSATQVLGTPEST